MESKSNNRENVNMNSGERDEDNDISYTVLEGRCVSAWIEGNSGEIL